VWNNVDFKSSWKWFLGFLLYLICLLILPNISFTEVLWRNGYPVAINKVYLFLQFFVCIFIVNITTSIFGESFKKSTYEYLLTYPLSTYKIIIVRVFRLFIIVCIIYVPVVIYLFNSANKSILDYIDLFPQYTGFPLINIFIPIVHCMVAVIFYIMLTLFLMLILKNNNIPAILIMAYCALEAGPLNLILGKYSIFRGSFNTQDFYNFLPENIKIMLILSLVFMFFIIGTYRKQ